MKLLAPTFPVTLRPVVMLTLPVPFGVNTILALLALVCMSNCAESTMAPLIIKLPAVMLPVETVKLVPVIAAPVMAPVAEIKPPVSMLPPVMLPVAVIRPLVSKLPPVMLPATLTVLPPAPPVSTGAPSTVRLVAVAARLMLPM